MSKFGEVLNTLLKERNIKKKDFAKMMCIESCTLSHWINRGSCPKDEMFIKIADYFDVSLDYLFGRQITEEKVLTKDQIQHKIMSYENEIAKLKTLIE